MICWLLAISNLQLNWSRLCAIIIARSCDDSDSVMGDKLAVCVSVSDHWTMLAFNLVYPGSNKCHKSSNEQGGGIWASLSLFIEERIFSLLLYTLVSAL